MPWGYTLKTGLIENDKNDKTRLMYYDLKPLADQLKVQPIDI